MHWLPLVTMWQVALDLPSAGNVPHGNGHLYSRSANLVSWVATINPDGWTQAETTRLTAILEARTPRNG